MIEKEDDITGRWVRPDLTSIDYPCLCIYSQDKIPKTIKELKLKLHKKIKNMSNINIVREYIFTLLSIDNIYTRHINNIENYYIKLAKNMSNLLESLIIYFDCKL